ncbi:MAG: hypothetical protein CMJ67_06445 [Planctomycetaceae bacterium]|nr:hypothetical protein [Planctomycetaceae bacterium]
MRSERKIRLAGYTTTALATMCHADIKVYDGPSIPIGLGQVQLELDGLQFEMGFSDRTFSGSRATSWWTCCSSTGGPTCNWSDIFFESAFYGTRVLSAFGIDGISTMDFLPIGKAPEGLQAPMDSTAGCMFSYRNIFRCGESSSAVSGNCDEPRTMYLGFTAPQDDAVVTGWIEIQRATSGSYAITRWAYEDDGSTILTGQVPEATCVGDIDESGAVDSADLGSLLAAWGDCRKKGECRADIDSNGRVDAADLGLLIAAWGTCPDNPCTGVDCSSDDPCILAACIDGICYTDDLQADPCDPGDCCVPNGSPGCNDDPCMEIVCSMIPDCCEIAWDSTCAGFALVFGCDCP